MLGDGIRKFGNQDDIPEDVEVVYDYKGNAYQVSDKYIEQQRELRGMNDSIEKKLARSIIEDGFSMLTERQKQVMKLVIEGLTQRQIANILGISRQAVYELKRRAKQILKDHIPKFMEEKEDASDFGY